MVMLKYLGLYLLLVYLVSFASSASYDYSYRDYGYDYHEESSMCYACEYGMEDGEPVGSEECGFKFENDVPKVECKDTCIIDLTMSLLEPDRNYMIYRGCVKKCQEVNNSTIRTKCCKSNLCNHGGFQTITSWAHCCSPLMWVNISLLLLGHALSRKHYNRKRIIN